MSKVDEARELEEAHQQFLQTELLYFIDLYDTKGEYSHSEERQIESWKQ